MKMSLARFSGAESIAHRQPPADLIITARLDLGLFVTHNCAPLETNGHNFCGPIRDGL